ncbi:MAG: hypothetical protein Q8N47_13435 [Bryobacterales bacterium]|nr:hypothetical protein [Bryobacterales bacterium]
MTLSRRDLLRGSAALAAGAPKAFFRLHPLIESNPKAVFICRTRVAAKTDSEAKLKAGLKLAREIFVPSATPGVPVSDRIVLKPNPTVVRSRTRPDIDNWGTGTDPQFYEGLILGLKELGLRKFHFVEANHFQTWALRGWVDINDRHGVEMNEPERRERNFRDSYQMTWSKAPEAVVYSRIPHYAPVNEPGTWLLNIAKWKAHGMCLTQSVKNEQGLVVMPFVRFCSGWPMVTGVADWMKPDIHPKAEERVTRYFENHRRIGYSRYGSQAELSPIRQEIWAHKTCDNQSVLKTGLAMIEGIYARDGDGFGVGDDYLTNLVMFGQDKWRLDLVGLWLGGHEPGNVHLYRIAKERGLSDTFNPWDVPVFEWVDGAAAPRKLSDFTRTPLKTYYLRKDGEPYLHMVDEAFDYDRHKI